MNQVSTLITKVLRTIFIKIGRIICGRSSSLLKRILDKFLVDTINSKSMLIYHMGVNRQRLWPIIRHNDSHVICCNRCISGKPFLLSIKQIGLSQSRTLFILLFKESFCFLYIWITASLHTFNTLFYVFFSFQTVNLLIAHYLHWIFLFSFIFDFLIDADYNLSSFLLCVFFLWKKRYAKY